MAALAAIVLGSCSEAPAPVPAKERALAALAAGDGATAEQALRELLAGGTPSAEIAAYLGEAALMQGQPLQAHEWLGGRRFSEDTAAHGFRMLGRLHMQEGRLAQAGAAFDRALALGPADARLWVDIGRLRYRGGEHALAIEAARRALVLDPGEADALLLQAQLARDAQGAAAALPWFAQALAAAPGRPDLVAEYGATLGEAGETGKMLETLRSIRPGSPQVRRIRFLQAVLAARAGDFALARTLLATAPATRLATGSATAGEDPAAVLLSGIVDLELGNPDGAAQLFDRLSRQQPDNPRVRDLLARALALSGNHRELIRRFDAVARRADASPYLQTVVARSHEALGDRGAAADLIDRAQQPRPTELVLLPAERSADLGEGRRAVRTVRARLAEGDKAAAIAATEVFLRRFPGSADARALAGDVRLAINDPAGAAALYQSSAAIRRPWPLARKHIMALSMIGRQAEAEDLLNAHVAGNPLMVEPMVMLARLRFGRGEMRQAALLLDYVLSAGVGRDPEVFALRSAIAERMSQPRLARIMAERAFALAPMHPAAIRAVTMTRRADGAVARFARPDRIASRQ